MHQNRPRSPDCIEDRDDGGDVNSNQLRDSDLGDQNGRRKNDAVEDKRDDVSDNLSD